MAFRGSGAALLLRGLRSSAETALKHERSGFLASFPAAQLAVRNAAACAQPAQPSTAARSCPGPTGSRGIRTGTLLWDSVQAVVPSMGDSITEGAPSHPPTHPLEYGVLGSEGTRSTQALQVADGAYERTRMLLS